MTHDTALMEMTSRQRVVLTALLDALIPSDAQRNLPSAADVGFVAFASKRGMYSRLVEVLEWIDRAAPERFSAAFESLNSSSTLELVTDRTCVLWKSINDVLLCVVQCYYQHPTVVAAIGLEPRPPFPLGFQVEDGDLLLLEPVYLRGKFYRDA